MLRCLRAGAAGHQPLPRGARRPQLLPRHALGGDDTEADPYLINDVRYLAPLNRNLDRPLEPAPDRLVLPCFPLGGDAAYVPYTDVVLNIFEPRYREMYSDILLSGGRRFVVPHIIRDESNQIRLAEVGVVFYLDDLQEVSEQTNDRVKYICSHSLIGRVRLKRVLNPRVFSDASSYLRVEAEDLVDTDLDVDCSDAEGRLMLAVREVGILQKKAEASVHFADEVLEGQNATRGAGFWKLVKLWQEYLRFRMDDCRQRFQRELEAKIFQYFEKQGKMPSQVSLGELPPKMQEDIIEMQQACKEELIPLETCSSERVQVLVQSASHRERLTLFQRIVEEDKRRLEARWALKSVFENPEAPEP